MKLVAEEYGRGNIEAIQQYVTTAIAILTTAAAAALIVILTFRTQITSAFKLTGENAQMVLWLLPYVASLSIYVFIVHVLNATLSGLGRMDLANWTQSAGRIAAVATASSLLYSGRGIESLLIGNIFSYVLVHVTTIIVIRRIAHIQLLRIGNLSGRCCKRLLGFGLGLFGGSVMNMLLSPFNRLMLSRYAGVSTIPVYEIAFTGAMQVRALIEAGLRALMPEVSRIGANMTGYAKDRISQIYRRAMRLIFVFGIPMYGGIIILLTPLLKLWLRQTFVTGLPTPFRIMLISTFLSLLSVPSYYTLLGMGMVRHTLTSHVILSCVNALIVLTIVFMGHNISVETVSWAILTATVLTTLYLNWQSKRRI
jgi:O-antigen/teichoic acid export membrane protein